MIVVAAFSVRGKAPLADPLATALPPTVMVAALWVLVGVTVIEETEFATVAE